MPTIAAISTPNAVGGISVIRISGEKSIGVAEKVLDLLVARKFLRCKVIPVPMVLWWMEKIPC